MTKLLRPSITFLMIIWLSVLLATCRNQEGGIQVDEIHMSPSERLAVGEEAALTIQASGAGELAFRWSADRGTLSSPQGLSTNYKAPSTPGQATVSVQITGEGSSVVKSKTFEIVDKPALSLASTPSTLPVGAVTLTSHKDGQTVPCEGIAKGRYSLDVTAAIWPVVYIASMYHPQDRVSKVNGNWIGTVRFGSCEKPKEASGKPFQLLVITADDAANQAFESYIQEGKKNGFPGMQALPPGITEHARILVTRD